MVEPTNVDVIVTDEPSSFDYATKADIETLRAEVQEVKAALDGILTLVQQGVQQIEPVMNSLSGNPMLRMLFGGK